MSRTGINYQDVAKAATKLQGLNENPTVDRVREILGTGSKSTIARHLKEWKGSNADLAEVKGLPAELVAIVSGLWDRLQNDAAQQLITYEAEFKIKLSAVESSLHQAQSINLDLQTNSRKLEEALITSEQQIKDIAQACAEEKNRVAQLQAQVSNLEQHNQAQQQENSKLHALLKNMQNNLEHYQEATQKLQQDQALNLDRQRINYEHELSVMRKQLEGVMQSEQRLVAQNQLLQQQLEQHELIEARNQQLESNCKELELKAGIIQEKYNELLNVHQAAHLALEAKTNDYIELLQKSAVDTSRIQYLESLQKSSEQKISALLQEQILLAEQKARIEGALEHFKEIA